MPRRCPGKRWAGRGETLPSDRGMDVVGPHTATTVRAHQTIVVWACDMPTSAIHIGLEVAWACRKYADISHWDSSSPQGRYPAMDLLGPCLLFHGQTFHEAGQPGAPSLPVHRMKRSFPHKSWPAACERCTPHRPSSLVSFIPGEEVSGARGREVRWVQRTPFLG